MWEFKFYSRGGQGAVTAAKILINAAIIDNKLGQAIPSYGQERKGAPVLTYARIDDKPIEVKSYVYRPNCVVVFDMGLELLGFDFCEGMREQSVLVVNSEGDPGIHNPKIGKLVTIPASRITEEVAGHIPHNVAMLGALVRSTGCVSIEALQQAIQSKLSGKVGELSAETCTRAYKEAVIIEAT